MDLKARLIVATISFLALTALFGLSQPNSVQAASGSGSNICNTLTKGDLSITAISADLHSVKIKNLSKNCVYQVGIASYQAVKPYNTKDWINTQQYFDGQTTTLNPGEEKLLSIRIPTCAYQSDVFQGSLLKSFNDKNGQTYARQNRLLTSKVNYQNRSLCSTGQVQGATPIPSKLPSTGPGDSVVVSFSGIVAALVGKKFILGR